MVLMGAMDKDEEEAGEWLPLQGSGVKARRGGRKPWVWYSCGRSDEVRTGKPAMKELSEEEEDGWATEVGDTILLRGVVVPCSLPELGESGVKGG